MSSWWDVRTNSSFIATPLSETRFESIAKLSFANIVIYKWPLLYDIVCMFIVNVAGVSDAKSSLGGCTNSLWNWRRCHLYLPDVLWTMITPVRDLMSRHSKTTTSYSFSWHAVSSDIICKPCWRSNLTSMDIWRLMRAERGLNLSHPILKTSPVSIILNVLEHCRFFSRYWWRGIYIPCCNLRISNSRWRSSLLCS